MQGEQFTVRPMRSGDFNDVVSNYYGYFEEIKRNPCLGIGLPEKRPGMKEEKGWFSSLMSGARKGDAMPFVAESDGKVVGLCSVTRLNMRRDSRHIGLLGIAIAEGYRSRGIGTALLKAATGKAARRYSMLVLEAYSMNSRALRLYRRFGFVEYGRLRGAAVRAGKSVDTVYLCLDLSRCRRKAT